MNCTKFDIDIVATGSSGNMTIVDGCIALDFGVPAKVLMPYIDKLSAILITHRHGDHMNPPALNALVKNRPGLLRSGLYINQDTYNTMEKKASKTLTFFNCDNIISAGEKFTISTTNGTYEVETYKMPHGDAENQAFVLTNSYGEKLLYAIDTETLDAIPLDMKFDVLLVEGNYDEQQIEEALLSEDAGHAFRAGQNLRHLPVQAFDDFVAHHANRNAYVVQMHESLEFGAMSGKSAYNPRA